MTVDTKNYRGFFAHLKQHLHFVFSASVMIFTLPVGATDNLADQPISYRYLSAQWGLYTGIEDLKPIDPSYGKLTKQPKPSKLKNQFDTDGSENFYQWFRNCDEKRLVYQKYLKECNTLKKSLEEKVKAGQAATPAELADYNQAQQNLVYIRESFMGAQGYNWTFTDENELEAMLYTSPFKKRSDLKKTKQLPPYGTTDPSRLIGENRVKGFLVPPEELSTDLGMLQRLNKQLERELYALQQVSLYYERNLKPDIRGWSLEHLTNWWNINTTTIPELQKRIDQEIRLKFDSTFFPAPPTHSKFKRDLSTDRGVVLAKLNADSQGARIKKITKNVAKEKNHEINIVQEEENNFEVIYHHRNLKNETESIEISNPENYQRSNKKQETFIPPITIFHSFPNPRKMIVLKKPVEPIKTWDKGKKEWVLQEPKLEAKDLPKGTFMTKEYIAYGYSMLFHRSIYRSVLQELQKIFAVKPVRTYWFLKQIFTIGDYVMNDVVKECMFLYYSEPVSATDRKSISKVLERTRSVPSNMAVTARWRYDPKLLRSYNQAYQEYLGKLKMLLQFHLEIHKRPTYFGVTSYIPTAWQFAHWELTQPAQTQKLPVSTDLDLSASGLADHHFEFSQKPMPTCVFASYLKVNLSNNDKLFGTTSFGYSSHLTSLNLSHCNLSSLDCINGLVSLEELDISHNQLSNFNFRNTDTLTKLTAAHNTFTNLRPLGTAVTLRVLDLSTNLLTSMCDLYLISLEELNVSYNPFLTLYELPQHASKLSLLNIKGCSMQNEDCENFKDKYFYLQNLTMDNNEISVWPAVGQNGQINRASAG